MKKLNYLGLVLLCFLASACGTPADSTQTGDEMAWLQGASLHNCTNAEWKAATQANKVATCADWIISLAKGDGLTMEQFKANVPPAQLKQMSENLAKEVDASVATGVSADNLKGECASYATLYWFALKAKVKENATKTK